MAAKTPIALWDVNVTSSHLQHEVQVRLGWTAETAREWIELGAVYVSHIDGGGNRRMKRVLEWDFLLSLGTTLRVHLLPKRFPACNACDKEEWTRRVMHEDEKFMLIDKPAGLPCMAHVSNYRETLHLCAAAALGRPHSLHVVNRLDTDTSGLTVVGKNKLAVAEFNRLLKISGAVEKEYLALATAPLQIGPLIHYMPRGGIFGIVSPRPIASVQHPKWRICIAHVMDCSKVEPFGWEVRIRLETGRTHQIRAQCAAVGAPLVGDFVYAPMVDFLIDDLELQREEALGKMLQGSGGTLVEGKLGLHCSKVAFGDVVAEARLPWWRT
jgi:23S rRNA-/tRNA-specific pseudouridylate synthase